MPMYVTGNIWNLYGLDGQVILVPTNAILNKKGELVMGAGAALAAKEKEVGIAAKFGSKLRCSKDTYNILWDESWDIWAFQSKYDYNQKSNLDLIEDSAQLLSLLAKRYPDTTFNLSWPGIGLGGLTKQQTKPILDTLPSNVYVWSFN